MADIKRLLEVRREIKKNKPNYLRQDSPNLKSLKKKWRRAKGIHSKMRRRLRGYKRSPEVGYGSPKEVRNLTQEGLTLVLIKSEKDLINLTEDSLLVISKNLGSRKKMIILKQIKEKGLKVENIDVDKFIENYESKIKDKKAEKLKKEKEVKDKEAKKKESDKKVKEVKEEPKEEIQGKVDKKEGSEKKVSDIKKKVLEKKTGRDS